MKYTFLFRSLLSIAFFLLFNTVSPVANSAPVRKMGCGAFAESSGAFDFSPLARKAYQLIFDLRIIEAQKTLDQMKKQEPENLIVLFLENYIDFITILVADDENAYKRRVKNMNPRLARIARGNRKSPWFLYTQAEIRLQWAMLGGKYSNYLSSLSDIKQAFALLEQNQREHPDFKANLKSLGLLHALIGNVPEEYRWSIKALGGMSGSVEQGMRELNEALNYAQQHNFEFEAETRIACAFMQLHLGNNKALAWKTITSGNLDARKSPVAAFVLAHLAMRTGRNDEAIKILETCPDGAAFYPFPYRYYLLGVTKLNRLDDDADRPLHLFIKNFKGKSGLKEAYQKLAWHQLVKGNEHGYKTYMQGVKTKGNDRSEPDQVALREANSGEMPDARLTRARLLFDGGYYQRAFVLLQNAASDYQGEGKQALEYTYRLARISDELGKSQDAIRLYSQTVYTGANKPWYFACSAALYLGNLHEQQGAAEKARTAYQRCLEIKPEEYASSLHARAKAGLNRL